MSAPVFHETNWEELEVGPPEKTFRDLIEKAAAFTASDLFFCTNEDSVGIELRQWGKQKKLGEVSLTRGQHLINYVKTAASMDIAEKRRPSDGRFIEDLLDKRIDLRVNSIPTLYGEDLAIRLMDREMSLKPLDELGMSAFHLDQLRAMLASPSGLILVTGPTGTGKTTTLYACLQHLNNGERKINTLEDPIEYAVPGFRQSQVNDKLGLDFPELLSNVLRQAPDVIMIGEIRDEQTAQTAVRAANSGHLVFATLHAGVAAGAVTSLLTRGVHPNFLSSCLLGVLAQRLVRELCPRCRVEYDLSQANVSFEKIKDMLKPGQGQAFYGPKGCEHCHQQGYIGRTGVFEVLSVDRRFRELISEGHSALDLHAAAVEHGLVDFHRAALLKVAQGLTSMEEVLATLPPESLGIEG